MEETFIAPRRGRSPRCPQLDGNTLPAAGTGAGPPWVPLGRCCFSILFIISHGEGGRKRLGMECNGFTAVVSGEEGFRLKSVEAYGGHVPPGETRLLSVEAVPGTVRGPVHDACRALSVMILSVK